MPILKNILIWVFIPVLTPILVCYFGSFTMVTSAVFMLMPSWWAKGQWKGSRTEILHTACGILTILILLALLLIITLNILLRPEGTSGTLGIIKKTAELLQLPFLISFALAAVPLGIIALLEFDGVQKKSWWRSLVWLVAGVLVALAYAAFVVGSRQAILF